VRNGGRQQQNQSVVTFTPGLPGGYRNTNGAFNNTGNNGNLWSSSENSTTNAWNRNLNYNNANVNRNNNDKGYGFSVRCLRDLTRNPAAAGFLRISAAHR